MKNALFLFLMAFLLGCSSAPTKPDTSWERTEYHEAPGIVSITTAWGRSHLCTGVLIKPQVVLTAAHCLGWPAEELYITHACSNVDHINCSKTAVAEYHVENKYRLHYVSSDDLGLLITSRPIRDVEIVEIYDGEYEINASIMQAGFGKRGGKMGILYNYMGRISKDYTFEFVAGRRGALDPHPGDSGGPAYILEDGKLKLAGILSRGIMRDKGYTGWAIYTKPAKYLDWVYEVTYLY